MSILSSSLCPSSVRVTEVGLRDGLQNEPRVLVTEDKLRLLNALYDAGLRRFELTSFVSPRAVPGLADAEELVVAAHGLDGAHFSALVPNLRGAERALEAGVDRVVLFVSASEMHNAKNVNRTIGQSLADFEAIVARLAGSGIDIDGAIATAFGCPFEGEVAPERVGQIARRLQDMGIGDVTLGDTTGMATPPVISRLHESLTRLAPEVVTTLHFHNTRGLALANVMQGLALGIGRYESAIGGLGGCPFAPGASGNLATEELVYLLTELGYETGVSLEGLIQASQLASRLIGRDLPSQVAKAGPRLKRHARSSVATASS